MYSSAPVEWAILYLVKNQFPTIIFLKEFNFIPVNGVINVLLTFFSVSVYSQKIDPLSISSRINWNFILICFNFWWMTGIFAKTLMDWLSQWIVVGFLSDSSSVIVLNSALRYKASWLVNDIAMNSALHVDKATVFCFLDFHEIIGSFSANRKQNPLTLFLSFKLPQSESQKPTNFKGFCNFLNISDWLIVPFK